MWNGGLHLLLKRRSQTPLASPGLCISRQTIEAIWQGTASAKAPWGPTGQRLLNLASVKRDPLSYASFLGSTRKPVHYYSRAILQVAEPWELGQRQQLEHRCGSRTMFNCFTRGCWFMGPSLCIYHPNNDGLLLLVSTRRSSAHCFITDGGRGPLVW